MSIQGSFGHNTATIKLEQEGKVTVTVANAEFIISANDKSVVIEVSTSTNYETLLVTANGMIL